MARREPSRRRGARPTVPVEHEREADVVEPDLDRRLAVGLAFVGSGCLLTSS